MNKMNNDMLKQIIIDTIKGEEHLGENLKEQCVDYIDQLQNNWNELKKWLEEEYKYYQKCNNPNIGHAMGQIRRTENKMQELEQGKDE